MSGPPKRKSRWHGSKPSYRFVLDATPPHQMTVEWDGTPRGQGKAFLRKYARNRDAFLKDSLPAGHRTLIVCPATGQSTVIEGTAA
jgi:hypothetical protein